MGVGSLLGSIVVLLDDNDLLSGLSTRENDGNLRGWAGRDARRDSKREVRSDFDKEDEEQRVGTRERAVSSAAWWWW